MAPVSERTKRRHKQRAVAYLLSKIRSNTVDLTYSERQYLSEENGSCLSFSESGISNDSESSESSDPDDITLETEFNFKNKLAEWAITHNITHLSLSDLLKLLRKRFPSDELPLNPRSLLRTPVLAKTILQLGKGKFYYFGVKENVGRRLSTGFKIVELPKHENFVGLEKENVISISVGIDGLPVCKSNNKSFWPILALVNQALDSTPFIVGIYFGSEKPPIDG
ncbi:unnamed protein product, partial [Allacma fusca]